MDFTHLSNTVWLELNYRHSRLSVEEQLDVALEVADVIEGLLDQIVEYTPKNGTLATKKSALETMRKIFETTCLSGGHTAHEVRKNCYGWGGKLLEVLDVCSDDELDALVDDELLDKFDGVVDLAMDLGILYELQEGLDILEGNYDTDDEMNEDDDGYDDSDDYDDHDDGDNCKNHDDHYSDDYHSNTSDDEYDEYDDDKY